MAIGDESRDMKTEWHLWRDNFKFFKLKYSVIPIQVSWNQWTFTTGTVTYKTLHVFGFRIVRWIV